MKKKWLSVVFAVFSAAVIGVSAFALSACDTQTSDGGTASSGKHVVDPNGMGGEGVLDDGGKINVSETQYYVTGIKKAEGKHSIIIGEDTSDYEIYCPEGYNISSIARTWSNSGITVNRLSTNKQGAYFTFTLDTSSLSDVSHVGVEIPFIHSRPMTLITVSTDKVNWTDLAWNEGAGVTADYKVKTTELRGQKVDDANLYTCYYDLSEYAEVGKPLYIRGECSSKYTTTKTENGTDVIDYVAWYENLEFEYEVL